MHHHDRDQHDRGSVRIGGVGGDWRGLEPSFDNPLTWSLRLAKVGGVPVRVHVTFPVLMVIVLLKAVTPAAGQTGLDLRYAAIAMAALFVLVLVHEAGHWLACRRTGGSAQELLLWPLGGLAACRAPSRPWPHLITALGGPAANGIVCAVAGATLWLAVSGVGGAGGAVSATAGEALHPVAAPPDAPALVAGRPTAADVTALLVPDPLRPLDALHANPAVAASLPLTALYLVYAISFILLAVNLVPMFPLDGARVVHALAWCGAGYSTGMRCAVRVGFVAAIGLAVAGTVTGSLLPVGLALLGAIIGALTLQQVNFTDAVMRRGRMPEAPLESGAVVSDLDAPPDDPLDAELLADLIEEHGADQPPGARGPAASTTQAPQDCRQRQAQLEAEENARVDHVLQKIARDGMGSLTAADQQVLKRATARRRAASPDDANRGS